MNTHLKLLALAAATAVLAAGAALAVPVQPAASVDLPPLPGTAFARKVQAQQREAHEQLSRLPQYTPAAWAAQDFAGMPAQKWTIVHQDITAEVVAATKTLSTTVKVTVRANKSGIQKLDFVSLEISDATVLDADGNELTATTEAAGQGYGMLSITLPAPLTVDQDQTFEVTSQAVLDCNGDEGLMSCSFDSSFKSVVLVRYYLWSAVSSYSPFTSDLHVITAADEVAAAPGVPSGPVKLESGKLIWSFAQEEITDNAGFSIAEYEPLVVDAKGDLPTVRVYAIQPSADNAQTMADLGQQIIAAYGGWFVKFPWQGLNMIQLANNFGGGYAPLGAAFLYGEVFGMEPSDQDYGQWQSTVELIAHEIAHQWWGNLVAPLGAGNVCLSESLSEFASCLYTETALDNRSQILGDNLSYIFTVPDASDRPMTSSTVYYSAAYIQIIYHKGAVVFDMLRRELGDEVMLKGLSAYAQKYHRDYAKVEQLRAVLEETSGQDLGWFFKQWFSGKGAIRAHLAARFLPQDDGTWTVRFQVTQKAENLKRFQLVLAIDLADGKTEERVVEIAPSATETVVLAEVQVPSQPVRVRADPQRLLLRAFTVTTPGDVNLSGLVDGRDLVDMAIRHGRGVVFTAKNGNDYFMPDTGFNEIYDVAPDNRIDIDDVDTLIPWAGVEAEPF
jgi:hypothetical protein